MINPNWYVGIKDGARRKIVLLAGPFDNKEQADAVADEAYSRFIAEYGDHDYWCFYNWGVLSTNSTGSVLYDIGKTPITES